ncbi:ribosomal L1 domain-containing protein 1 [Galendromus occidentalis]|uniref:Ribosomal L1 domain-containing protein 1 n=1 Tax=Galendromus occidentalis TaxID=34638 RepID=A0AAJ6QWI9_9ACAR|nr:ribosomal L1 domain-containing protein 1 [Galendromus occidentalis]
MVPKEEVIEAVKAFRKLRDVELSKKKKASILDSDDRNDRFVHLQLTVKKMSASQRITMVPFIFPHCLVQEDDEVCFIVGCRETDKGNKRADHERYANEYKHKLRKLGIEREIHILPVMQLETEFKPFEAKRKLCQAFDHFICDHRILFRMPQLLGTSFFKRRKLPIRVYMKDEEKLKDIIEEAIQKTLIYITPEGPNVSMKVGNLHDHTDEQIAENIQSILDVFIPESLPGGESNLNSMHLASFAGRSVPLYLSLASANTVDLSEADKKFIERQTPKEIEDTIDTMPGVRVKVRSDGKVIAVKDDSQKLETDELLDSDYLDVFREQDFEEQSEARKRHVKHMARKALLRKAGKRFGSNMLKLPTHVPLPKPSLGSLNKQQRLPKQKKQKKAGAGAKKAPVLDALQGFDETEAAPVEDECPQLVPIDEQKPKKRRSRSSGATDGELAVPELPRTAEKKEKAQRKSTTGFVQNVIPEIPSKKALKKNRKSDFVVEQSPKNKSPKSFNKQGMTVTRIEPPAPGDKSGKIRIIDTPRPILKTPRKTPGSEKPKSVTFDFTPENDLQPGKTGTAGKEQPSTPLGKAGKRKVSTGLFDVSPLNKKGKKVGK